MTFRIWNTTKPSAKVNDRVFRRAERQRESGARRRGAATERVRRAEQEARPPSDIQPRIEPGECLTETCGPEAGCMPAEGNTHYCLCTHTGQFPTADLRCPVRNTVPLASNPIRNIKPPPPRINSSAVPPLAATATYPPTEEADVLDWLVQSIFRASACVGYGPRFSEQRRPTSRHNTTVGSTTVLKMLASCRAKLSKVDDIAHYTTVSMRATSVGVEAGAEGAMSARTLAAAGGGALILVLAAAVLAACYARRRAACLHAGKAAQRVRPGEPLLADRYITNPQYGVCVAPAAAAPAAPGAAGAAVLVGGEAPVTVSLIDGSGLVFLEEVGEGCFGKVHKGLLRQGSGEKVVAIKVLKQSAGRSAEEDFIREVTIMSAFQHPNILALIGVVYREEALASPWMVFEYMEWGDLAGVLRGARAGSGAPALDAAALLHVALQVARGMSYLAARRFVHRDLAARNCLVGAQLAVKIADFGMSRDVYTCDYYKMGGERPMPVRWMSPESIVYARFTLESDVWSFGVVLWEIYSRGKQPFYGHNNEDATKLILQGIMLVPPEDCPRYACELMRSCWRSDPADRVGFAEIRRKLEAAAGAGEAERVPLPLPPQAPLDAAGYLVPSAPAPPDYLTTIADPETDSSEDDAASDVDDFV